MNKNSYLIKQWILNANYDYHISDLDFTLFFFSVFLSMHIRTLFKFFNRAPHMS